MTEITNYTVYNEGMRKSLLDKIFFMDKIDAKIIVDFGCADGTLIHFLSTLFPEYKYIGYDIDKTMLEKAVEKCGTDTSKFVFASDWCTVQSHCRGEKSAILLSSVIHEIFAYGTMRDVSDMWHHVYNFSDQSNQPKHINDMAQDFDYIIIRDMIPSITMDKASDINDVKKVMRNANSGCLREFEQVWGSIEQNKNLTHFLLKYRYTDNWSREVRENYFPLSREELLATIPDKYDIEFHEHFILPYQRNIVKQDFGIDLKDNTHLKLILKRNK